MVEGFHEYFRMKEEMDKAVLEQENIVEQMQENQLGNAKESQPVDGNRMQPPMQEALTPPRGEGMSPQPEPPMGAVMPPTEEPPMGGGMRPLPEPPMNGGMQERPEPPMSGGMQPRPEPPMSGGMQPRPEPPRPARPGSRPQCSAVHVIKEGDTLYKISRMHNVKVVDLLLANPYVNVYNLQIGDEICVPIKPVPFMDNNTPYIIRKEDTLGSVLEKNDLTFEELAECNPFVKKMSLPVNNVIFLPGKEEK